MIRVNMPSLQKIIQIDNMELMLAFQDCVSCTKIWNFFH